MEKEIEVPSFVNENYIDKKKQREEQEKRVQKLRKENQKLNHKVKVYGALLAVLAAGGIALAVPHIDKAVRVYVEHDNENFNKEMEENFKEVEELTGRTPEEIMKSGNQR